MYLLFENDASFAYIFGSFTEVLASVRSELEAGSHEREGLFPMQQPLSVKVRRYAIAERHQMTCRVNSLTAKAC